ncbi:uncharacterized protein [Rutidosis leptorrhynchoides]|uniref:uncharacterized protein n=1 Tax=Rutidosis leptorrhynchoides TaxID=125765 RepID=UPI003A9946AB
MSDEEDTVTLINKLDFGDPLYLHASDTSGTSLISLKLKGTENYSVWSRALTLALSTKNKKGFIDGTCVRNDYADDEVLLNQWERCNAVVLRWILTSVSDELYLGQIFSTDASVVWQELKETYDKIDGSVTFNLHHKINSLTQGQSSLSEYYHKLNGLWKQYDALIKLPACTCEANKDFQSYNKLIKLMQFLMGLNDVYQPVAYAILSREESHRGLATSHVQKVSQTSNFLSKTGVLKLLDILLDIKKKPFNQFAPKFVANNNSSISNKSTNNNDVSSSGFPFTEEQIQKLMSLISKDDDPSTYVNANMANWIVDSGANQHMVCSEDGLIDKVDITKFNVTVGHPNGTKGLEGELIHLNVWGPYRIQSREGYKSFLTIVDDFTRAVWVYLLKTKDQVFDNFVEFHNLIKNQFNVDIKVIRSDNGTEFCNNQMETFCHTKGIIHQTSCPYTPQQNGVAERKHRHLLNVVRSLMFQGGLPLNFWRECVLTAIYLVNRLPTAVLSGKSPFECIFSFKPNLFHIRVFGYLCYATILNINDKFTNRAAKCVLIGYSSVKKGYKLYNLETKTVLFTRDVKFYETIFLFKKLDFSKNNLFDSDVTHLNFFYLFTENDFTKNNQNSKRPNDEGRDTEFSDGTTDLSQVDNNPINVNKEGDQSATLDEQLIPEGTSLQNDNTSTLEHGETSTIRRSERTAVLPKRFADYVVESKLKHGVEKVINYSFLNKENFCFVSNLNKSIEPTSYFEAAKDKNWVDAMNDEIFALNRNNTWVLVDLSPDRKPIGSKWVYKIKYKSNGEIERYKARLVAKGFNQREGIDYEETFSPVVKMVTVRILINLAINKGWILHQLDVNNAFLYGEIVEDVYMTLPEGYFNKDKTKACKLIKSLYGLKQPPRKWNEKLTSVLKDNGFVQSINDYSLYTKTVDDIFLVILVYVDDIIITGELIHFNVWGPYRIQSREGYKSFLTIVDDFTRAVWVYLLKTKDQVFDNFVEFHNLIKNQFNVDIKVIRSDNGTEFCNNQMETFCHTKGIIHQTSCPYTPQQNGVAERKHRHLLNVVRSLMFQGGLPLNFWSECVLTAVYLVNRLPTAVLSGKSPFECIFGFKPNLSHIRVFGYLCYATILNINDKFTNRAAKCVLIGYSSVKKGYKLYNLETKTVLFTRDVKFYETIFLFKKLDFSKNNLFDSDVTHLNFFDLFTENDFTKNNQNSKRPNDEGRDTELSDGTTDLSQVDNNPINVNKEGDQSATLDEQLIPEGTSLQNDNTSTLEHGETSTIRRTERTAVLPKRFADYVVESKVKHGVEKVINYSFLNKENFCFVSNLNKSIEPTSYFEAAKDKNWVDAMNDEIFALNRNNTWVLVDLPPGRKPIGSKWVYKIKYKSNGEIERYKARLVAKGFNQREGIDYEETFSPVVKMVTVRILINLAINKGWILHQLDVNNAFLYGEIVEDVYMTPPEGYFNKDKIKAYKLIKSLYGLKQAPRKWNEKLTSVLKDNGFVQSINDYSLYTKTVDDIFLVILVYVDDIIITGNNENEIKKLKAYLSENFMIKDLGKLKYFLEIEVLDIENGVCMNQRKYCLELLQDFGMLGCKPISTPMEQNVVVDTECNDKNKKLEDISYYQKLVGKLIYLTMTRPDIAYAVHCLSQFMHSPLECHLKLAFHVLRYLKQSPGRGVSIVKSTSFDLIAFVDTDWAKSMSFRKSVNGYCVFMGDSLISWKKTCIPVPLLCDSKSAIQIAANPVFHEKTKHLEVDVHFIREKWLVVEAAATRRWSGGVWRLFTAGTET